MARRAAADEPTTSTLVGHILDRLEYACARDVADARLIISSGVETGTLTGHGVALLTGLDAVLHALHRSGDQQASRRVTFGDADDYLSCEDDYFSCDDDPSDISASCVALARDPA